ncbi:hypothetical protein [Streptomyces sp. NPDC008001]|uniref:hypothetical protein n=1 Tax=Streptomyces sp. NPDC008001 TaxID=3364804 RepID=UPI0036EF8C97
MDMRRAAFTVTENGSYAARLALDGATGGWFPERWTLDGPEPYAVPLPGSQPEEPDSEVQPLADGRVLIRRRVAERHTLSLLYPTGPGTGELPVGAVECARLSLLPPAPGGSSVYGLEHAERSTVLWRLQGGSFGPERIVEVAGHCAGGAWLDRTGRLLALDRELDGRTKTVVLDLERGGETSPLLQITEESNDRLLLADPYSGLLLVRSDAPGQDRLGWGVLGSARPVRFPECLRPAGAVLTPFAAQPGQELTPEGCAVAFRVEGATGSWVGVWRPAGKQLQQFPAPAGWLVGAGLWTSGGELRLPFVTPYVRCGLARLRLPEPERDGTRDTGGRGAARDGAPSGPPRTAAPQAPLLQGVPRPLPPEQPPLLQATATATRPSPEQPLAGGPRGPLLQAARPDPERPSSAGPEVPLLQGSRPGSERLSSAGPQVPLTQGPGRGPERPSFGEAREPLLQAARPGPEQPPSGGPQVPLLQGSRPGSEQLSSAGVQPPLLQVARPAPEHPSPAGPQVPLTQGPGRGPEQPSFGESQGPLLQAARPVPASSSSAVPQTLQAQASGEGPEPLFPAAPESTASAAPQPLLLQDGPRTVSSPQSPQVSRPLPEPASSVSVSHPSQMPLLHDLPLPVPPARTVRAEAEPSVSATPQPPLLQTSRPDPELLFPAAPQAVRPAPEPAASAAPQMPQASLLQDLPRTVSSTPAARPVPEPAPSAAPQSPSLQMSRPDPEPLFPVAPEPAVSVAPQTPPQGVPRPAPAPEAEVSAAQPQSSASLLRDVPEPQLSPQAGRPLLEPPHEGVSAGPPQADRAESPTSVWTAVPPTGLPGAGMPGAWSVAASAARGAGPSRPVPLQQAPLGREHRP